MNFLSSFDLVLIAHLVLNYMTLKALILDFIISLFPLIPLDNHEEYHLHDFQNYQLDVLSTTTWTKLVLNLKTNWIWTRHKSTHYHLTPPPTVGPHLTPSLHHFHKIFFQHLHLHTMLHIFAHTLRFPSFQIFYIIPHHAINTKLALSSSHSNLRPKQEGEKTLFCSQLSSSNTSCSWETSKFRSREIRF